jgi:D-sedoheptulose 7-phosphate isomerase
MKQWIADYVKAQAAALESVPAEAVEKLVALLKAAHAADRRVFIFGNGGSAANASHFATDLGKGASDRLGKRFRVLSLTDNVAWMTALGNDYSYDDVFVGQLQNFAQPGDLVISISVSGNSPNCVKALEWAGQHGLHRFVIVGGKRGRMAGLAEDAVVIGDTHYGRVEDVHMNLLHMACYAFIEGRA